MFVILFLIAIVGSIIYSLSFGLIGIVIDVIIVAMIAIFFSSKWFAEDPENHITDDSSFFGNTILKEKE